MLGLILGAKDVEVSSSQFEGFSVETSDDNQPGDLKVCIHIYI